MDIVNDSGLDFVQEVLDRFPNIPLVDQPSPIHRLRNLERDMGSQVEIYVKRDDLLRPLSGNKIRYLEFILGDYKLSNADCIIHAGGLTSNYLTQLAIVGAAEQIPIHLIVRAEEPDTLQGNLLLSEIFGAKIHYIAATTDLTNKEIKEELACELKSQGITPYVIDYPLSNYHSYLGYMKGYLEIVGQIASGELPQIDHIYLCSGWHSYLGLVVAESFIGKKIGITSIRPSHWKDSGLGSLFPDFQNFLHLKIKEFAEFLGMTINIGSFDNTEDYVGLGYGNVDNATLESISLVARTEGMLLDPIYTGKAMTGLLDHISTGKLHAGTKVLFIHTGGWSNLPSFSSPITKFLRNKR